MIVHHARRSSLSLHRPRRQLELLVVALVEDAQRGVGFGRRPLRSRYTDLGMREISGHIRDDARRFDTQLLQHGLRLWHRSKGRQRQLPLLLTAPARRAGVAVRTKLCSARKTVLGVIGFHTRVVLNPLIVLNQLGRDAIGQVSRHMIECSGLKVSDPHEDFEIRH